MSGHTPGPWFLGEDLEPCEGARSRAIMAQDTFIGLALFDAEEDVQAEANARLIAAAPDLLEPAPTAADLLDQYAEFIRTVKADDLERHPYLPFIEQTVHDLRAAIARATGES